MLDPDVQSTKPRLIKRYANRKLYDTRASRYVTLPQIAQLVRSGEDVQIIDNVSKENLTSVTLALALAMMTAIGMVCAANTLAADSFASNVLPLVRQMQASGAKSLAELAAGLNNRGVQTARGGVWHPMTVRNLLARGVGQWPPPNEEHGI